MGRFISYGIACQYDFNVKDIHDSYKWRYHVTEDDVRKALKKQMFPEIYDCIETEDSCIFDLRKDLSVQDLIDVIKGFWKVSGYKCSELEEICEALSGMTFEEAVNCSKKK